MKVAIVGITGLVGRKIAWLLEKRHFPVTQFIPIASKESEGKQILFKNESISITTLENFIEEYCSKEMYNMLIFFASSKQVSEKWIPEILNNNINAWIIDNSSHYRLFPNVPLVIPEINSHILTPYNRLISNPNCSTAQLVMVLHPLHSKYKIKRVVVSTYQSVSGAGHPGEKQLHYERMTSMKYSSLESDKIECVFPTKIDLNCIPICDILDNDSGYTGEEIKLERETPKILGDNIKLTATAVRVPVTGGHSESVNIEFENEYDLNELIEILKNTKGIKVKDMACPVDVYMETDVWVSRIRRDFTQEKSLNLWIVADNLMKGAALNAVQISEFILEKYVIST